MTNKRLDIIFDGVTSAQHQKRPSLKPLIVATPATGGGGGGNSGGGGGSGGS